jgi:hypothetical protein
MVTTMNAAPTPFGRLLDEIGWTPETLARAVNRFAQRQGRPERVHLKTPFRWRTGASPRAPWPTLVAAVLSERLHRTITPADLGWGDDTDLVDAMAGLALPWTTAGALQAGRVVTEGGNMYRRMFLTMLGTSMTSPALEWLIAHPAGDVTSTAGHALPIDVVDHLDAMTGSLRRMDDHLGGANTLGLVRQHLRTVIDLIEHRRYTDTVGRRLHSSAGELLRLDGWLSFDSGMHAGAQRFWVAGLYAAHAAGDRGLGANILGFMSCQAKDLGEIREAVTLAETARSGYPTGSPQVATILDLRAAEAYANAGDTTRCRAAIDAAFARFTDPTPSTGNPDWAYWVTPAQADAQAGYCHLKLKDWPQARTHLRRSLSAQGDESAREGALRNLLLASTYVRQQQPDLDRVVRLGDQAVEILTGQVNSARCVRHVRNLVDDLEPHRQTPAVKRFRDNAAGLLQTTGV